MRIERRWAGLRRLALSAISTAVLANTALAAPEEPEQTTTQATMRGIFVALSTAYTYSLDPDAFADPANRQRIAEVLHALATNTSGLEDHGGGLDASFDYLRRSLSRDAHDAARRFEQGNYIGSRFVLSKITENCVTCHTKLPTKRQFDLGAAFVETADIKKLQPTARVNIEIATRQFDAALETYEEILRSPDTTADDLALFGVFESYLKIALGALDDTQHPVRAFEEFAERTDMPKNLMSSLEHWIETLNALDLHNVEVGELDAARGMVEHAVVDTRSGADRSQLVDFVAATTLLHRYLSTSPDDDLDVAEAYYLLGVAESYISRSYWLSETEFLLEKAIRRAPGSEVAKKAYAFLDEYTRSGYRVTPARAVSPERQANLDELRQLIEN
ncbi:MAG: hypothetical protein OEN01_06825 [Candidatus Krumholzibacteria bacterium]|nr:hypothetical protein [Candidatus Krumholzibacteria bacterium]